MFKRERLGERIRDRVCDCLRERDRKKELEIVCVIVLRERDTKKELEIVCVIV